MGPAEYAKDTVERVFYTQSPPLKSTLNGGLKIAVVFDQVVLK